MNIVDRFIKIIDTIPPTVRLVAVSKTKPAALIEELYLKTGHKLFGENKVQELGAKQQILPEDINWHFIGHLQTNKIKYISPFVSLIQGVDSEKLLVEINREATKINRNISCLLQFHIAKEEAKYGFSIEEVLKILDSKKVESLTNISICGVMGMATFTKDEKLIGKEFRTLYGYFEMLKKTYFSEHPEFYEVSMGMTDDYLLAIEEGSTLIRVGSGIFGER